MKALVQLSNGKILTFTESTDFGGPWGGMLRGGLAVLLELPANELPEDVKFEGGAVVVDVPKKADRVAKAQAKAARKARLQTHNPGAANNVPELRAIVADLLDEAKG